MEIVITIRLNKYIDLDNAKDIAEDITEEIYVNTDEIESINWKIENDN